MRKNKFFLRQYSFGDFFHGGIGYSDAEKIMQKSDFKPIEFPFHHSFSLGAKGSRFFYFLKTWLRIKKGDVVVFIFPVFAKMHRLLLKILSFKKDVHLVCFVADIDGIKDGNKSLLDKEIDELKRYKYFIAHNDSMKKWLQSHFSTSEISIIGFFDFLTLPFEESRPKTKQVVFAGNLEKSSFLEDLYLLRDISPELHFNLYGPGYTDKMILQENVSYKGVIEPYKLPASVQGSFGLVWDGDSIEAAGGSLGDYMRYISHHKLSLYILSGLPLIVPAIAASAPLVRKYNIGVVINNLYETGGVIDKISEEDYRQMRNNLRPIAQKISTGRCLNEAIEELMNRM